MMSPVRAKTAGPMLVSTSANPEKNPTRLPIAILAQSTRTHRFLARAPRTAIPRRMTIRDASTYLPVGDLPQCAMAWAEFGLTILAGAGYRIAIAGRERLSVSSADGRE